MRPRRRARTVDGVNMQPHIVRSKLTVIGLAVASLAVAASSSAGQVRHSACYGFAWQRLAGGISEMVSCGSHGVSGTRAQFVEAATRPVDPPFLWQLAH
jgi:hypothetical protein